MRERKPEPNLFVSPGTAAAAQIVNDEWVHVETTLGRVTMQVKIRDSMPDGLVRVPHGWWKPETAQGLAAGLSGALEIADSILCRDDDDYLDREQGIPHLKGAPCRLVKLSADAP